MTPRQSVGAELGGQISRFDSDAPFFPDITEYHASAGLLHSMDLWGFETTERIGDLRRENALRIEPSGAGCTELRLPSTAA